MTPLPWSTLLGHVLLHSLWEGLVVCALTWLSLRLLASRSAQARYLAACIGLAGLLLGPLLTLAVLWPSPGGPPGPGPATSPWMPWLGTAWVGGSLAMSLRLVTGWAWAQRLRWQGARPVPQGWQARLDRIAEELGLRRAVRLLASGTVTVPTVLGWLRPVVLVPSAVLAGMPPALLELVLAHELAHVRRWDYLVNLLQCLVEALLFYHPAAWWIGRQIRLEREHACDDQVLALGRDPLAYARALAGLEAFRQVPAPEPQLALAATGGVLMNRIRRIVAPATLAPSPRTGLVAALALASLGGGALYGVNAEERPREKRVIIHQEGTHLDLRLKGEAKVDPKAEGGVALGEGGRLELRVQEAAKPHRFVVRKEGTRVTRVQVVDGQEKPLDPEAEALLKRHLETLQTAQDRADKVRPPQGDEEVDIQIRERKKDDKSPRIYIYRSGTGSLQGKGPEGLRLHMEQLHRDLKDLPRPHTFRVEAKGPDAAEIHTIIEEGLKAGEEGRKAGQAARRQALEALKVVIEARKAGEEAGRTGEGVQRKFHVELRRHEGPEARKHQAEALRLQIERLQKRLADLEKAPPVPPVPPAPPAPPAPPKQ